MEKCLLIVNPHAGGGRARERVEALLAELRSTGACFETAYTSGPGHATVLARDAAPQYDTLVAVGGDGTVGEVATGILTGSPNQADLAILPLGTGNDASLTLGIADWQAGVAALRGSARRRIDVIECEYATPKGRETRMALIGVGIGFPATVVSAASEGVKRVLGRWGYMVSAVGTAFSYRTPRMRVETDGTVREGRVPLAAVANMEWTGGRSMRMAPGALCDDGWLNVIVVNQPVAARLIRRIPRIMAGTHIGLPEVDYFPAREVLIESDPPADVMVDADLSGTTPATFRVRPGALSVRVPSTDTRP